MLHVYAIEKGAREAKHETDIASEIKLLIVSNDKTKVQKEDYKGRFVEPGQLILRNVAIRSCRGASYLVIC